MGDKGENGFLRLERKQRTRNRERGFKQLRKIQSSSSKKERI